MKKDATVEHSVFNSVRDRYKNSVHSSVLHFISIDAPLDKSDKPELMGGLHLNVPNYHVYFMQFNFLNFFLGSHPK